MIDTIWNQRNRCTCIRKVIYHSPDRNNFGMKLWVSEFFWTTWMFRVYYTRTYLIFRDRSLEIEKEKSNKYCNWKISIMLIIVFLLWYVNYINNYYWLLIFSLLWKEVLDESYEFIFFLFHWIFFNRRTMVRIYIFEIQKTMKKIFSIIKWKHREK